MTNPEALGRFKPGYVIDSGEAEVKVTLATNLTGTPVRFSLSESLTQPVSQGTLMMLNADLSELGEMQVGVNGPTPTEEDVAQWGTFQERAEVEPNQMVWVTEGFNDQTCTTYWRVTDCNAYTDENDVPYVEITLESLPAISLLAKVDTLKIGSSDKDWVVCIMKPYYDALLYWGEEWSLTVDNMQGEAVDVTSEALANCRVVFENGVDYLTPFIELLKGDTSVAVSNWAFTYTMPSEITYLPIDAMYFPSDLAWDIVNDILGMNGYACRFTRAKELIFWSVDSLDPPLGNMSAGKLGTGLTYTFSKDGVVTDATVTCYSGKKKDGYYLPDGAERKSTQVQSQAATNITNGEVVKETYDIPEQYLIGEDYLTVLESWGKKELYKTVLSARGANVMSDGLPLVIEVGMTVSGTSSLMGGVTFFVSTLDRTTDVQQNKCSTSISGSIKSFSETETTVLGWI